MRIIGMLCRRCKVVLVAWGRFLYIWAGEMSIGIVSIFFPSESILAREFLSLFFSHWKFYVSFLLIVILQLFMSLEG